MQAGKNILASKINETQSDSFPYPCFGGNGVRGFVADPNKKGSFPLIGRQGALCGCINLAEGEFYATEHAVVTTCFDDTNIDWACAALEALNLNQYATATAQPGLAVSKIAEVLLPIPPATEQARIEKLLTRIKSIITDYDALETARGQLDTELPDRLRKSILQMAVQGKLVPQDPNDEPASVLLERIREQRRQLIAEGKIKAPKGGESVIYRGSDGGYYEKFVDVKGHESEAVCIDDEIPFEIPENWEWARLGSLAEFGGGATPDKGNRSYWGGNIPWASMKDIHGKYLISTIDSITLEGLQSKPSITLCEPNQLIVSTRLNPGKTIISRITCAINQDLKVVHTDFSVDYLSIWFESRLDYFKKLGMGTTVPGIKLNDLESALLPVPSGNEIPRIVSLLAKLSILTNQ